jgi:pentatricopeptide repeat protein
MQREAMQPNKNMFKQLAYICFQTKDPDAALKVVGALSDETVLDTVDCSNLIRALSECNKLQEALSVLDYMDRCSIRPDSVAYTFLLKACANAKDIAAGKRVYSHIVNTGVRFTMFMNHSLLNMYLKCGDLESASSLFQSMHNSKILQPPTYNMMISAYGKLNDLTSALKYFSQMKQQGIKPDYMTYLCLTSACSASGTLSQAKELHQEMKSDATVQLTMPLLVAFMKLYVKFKDIESALGLYKQMKDLDLRPDGYTYSTLLILCAELSDFDNGKHLHQELMAYHIRLDAPLHNALIKLYGRNKDFTTALDLYKQMKKQNFKPDPMTFVYLLSSCAEAEDLTSGKELHEDITRSPLQMDTALQNALLNMYGKCKDLQTAIELFRKMKQLGVTPDTVAYTCLLSACTEPIDVEIGRELHQDIVQSQIELTEELQTSIYNMYVRCKDMKAAQQIKPQKRSPPTYTSILKECTDLVEGKKLHQEIMQKGKPDTEQYNALLKMYANCKDVQSLISIYEQMELQKKINTDSYVIVLNACGDLNALKQGKEVHHSIKQNKIDLTFNIFTALINMYCKGKELPTAIELYSQMLDKNMTPSRDTFIALISTCGEVKDLKQGKSLHLMTILKDVKGIPLSRALFTMYAKCGDLKEALQIFDQLDAEAIDYNTLLTAIRGPGN